MPEAAAAGDGGGDPGPPPAPPAAAAGAGADAAEPSDRGKGRAYLEMRPLDEKVGRRRDLHGAYARHFNAIKARRVRGSGAED